MPSKISSGVLEEPLRVLAVCESAPTLDPRHGNGSTLIAAQVLSRLPDDMDLDLVYFDDAPVQPAVAVTRRCSSVTRVPLRSRWAGWAALPVTALPRATWLRTGTRGSRFAARHSRGVDVTYFHGLHSFAPVSGWPTSVVVNEVDPWSLYWAQRSQGRTGPRACYDRVQAHRAARLERLVAARASAYVVVSEADAARLRACTGGAVQAIANGLDLDGLHPRMPGEARADTLVFVGTLDYPPNVQALRILCTQVWPVVRSAVPAARLVIAGRRAGPEVAALVAPGIQVLGEVDSVRSVFAMATAAIYPGDEGQGLKNTLREALAVGCPVVASPVAARGLASGPHLAVAADPQGLARRAIDLLVDLRARESAEASARAYAATLQSWDQVAGRYAQVLRDAAAGHRIPAA
jgi:glycosyltransferase involved in cell wall biosynthesis